MLLFVGVAGVYFAALRSATEIWTGLIAFITLAVLLSGVLAAVYSRGRERAFWLGFALFGWAYILSESGLIGPWFNRSLNAHMDPWAEAFSPFAQRTITVPMTAGDIPPELSKMLQQNVTLRWNFVAISRMAFALLFALVGGLIGWLIAGRADEGGRGYGTP